MAGFPTHGSMVRHGSTRHLTSSTLQPLQDFVPQPKGLR